MNISSALIENHGLTLWEYEEILRLLGREPNITELGIFSVMWSEHCSYKSSRRHLKKLPTRGPCVIQGPGENAGVVDLGSGLAAVFKIESHNHPSYIEPYQGAATGVGGIIRDIFTMGARPVALMNSLHFGPLEQTRNQVIMEGVVAGIAGYGNCMGIATVGGEVRFHPSYSRNPLVNAFCLGIAPSSRIFYGKAAGVGNPVIYAGARTGRDGIHGATMASEEFSDGAESKRPNVQVGDPFLEKLLLEACLEAMAGGAVVGIQDMGAAGLTCSTCEMGSRSGVGVEIDLALVPQREEGMTPYEIMLSESQERMLLVVEKGREEEVLAIFRKWDLDAVVIGRVREGGNLTVLDGGVRVAEIPNLALTDGAPVYDRPARGPGAVPSDWRQLELATPADLGGVLLEMVGSQHLCSRLWVYRQYDHQVGDDTVLLPGSDAAVLRLKQGVGGLAMTLDGNPRFCKLDPRQGARLAVAESCRNLVCSGARPLAATNCLNFASPESPEVMWQFTETVEGLAEACAFFETPVTGGNVSFYNETNQVGIFPTPVVGMIGKVESLDLVCDIHFRHPGDLLYLLGESGDDLGGSVYLEILGVGLAGPCPNLDLATEKELHDRLLSLIEKHLVESVHDLSEGGLAVALAECCFENQLGVDVSVETTLRSDTFLFGETPSRVLVSVSPRRESAFLEVVGPVPVLRLGAVGERGFKIELNGKRVVDLSVDQLSKRWSSFFEEVFAH